MFFFGIVSVVFFACIVDIVIPLIITQYANSRVTNSDDKILKAKFKNQPSVAEKVQRYIQMKELSKLRRDGGSYQEVKSFMINGTKSPNLGGGSETSNQERLRSNKGYQKLVGKGSLDQRLRAIVAYKRSSIAADTLASEESNGLSAEEELELEKMMEVDIDDYDDSDIEDGDDEEAEYESLVLQAIEQNKLNELQRNFLLDKSIRNDVDSIFSNITSDLDSDELNAVSKESSEDLYTPARSSWGVFKRPRDISRAYGGGRSITKEEMDRMDEEWEQQEKRIEFETQVAISSIAQKEKDNFDKIKTALSKARVFLSVGNRAAAVQSLAEIQDQICWHTDLGGEVQLEYAMALETVDRAEEARQIYGKLTTISWSQKVRGQAVQLLQGLEITRQIRKDVAPSKPFMDYANMRLVSEALKPGLVNEWDDYSKDKKYYKIRPWYDDGSKSEAASSQITNVQSLADAYTVLSKVLDPLKSMPVDLIRQAFRRVRFSNETEILALLKSRGLVRGVVKSNMSPSPPIPSTKKSVQVGETFQSVISTITGGLRPELDAEYTSTIKIMTNSTKPAKIVYDVSDGVSGAYYGSFNGTWDLVLSFDILDVNQRDCRSKRYEYGDMRWMMKVDDRMFPTCVETAPVMWGLSTVRYQHSVRWDSTVCEVVLVGAQVYRSLVPWQKKGAPTQAFQLIYCDDTMKVIYQAGTMLEREVYMLWKRVPPVVWKKY